MRAALFLAGAAVALSSSAARATCPGLGGTCPQVCYDCGAAPDPVSGTNPSLEEWRALFVDVAQREGAPDLPDVATIEVGASRTREAAPFPCRLLPAIAATEAGMAQFCEDSGLTKVSFDCGYGVMQVTSGAEGYPGLEARADVNVAAGADILATKWNGDEVYGGSFGDSDPALLESWYFAVWAYNGFVYRNNPNNPDFPADRPPYLSPGGLSRGSYPYQEIVWGYLRRPIEKEGEPVVEPVEVSYPTNIPDQSGLFSVNLALPDVVHPDPCVEVCPPQGCPDPALRTLILDDADPGFSLDGEDADAVVEHAEGGFRDRFLSAPAAPAGQPTVVARFVGAAPASGTWRIAGFIPLDPATSERLPVVVRARGAPSTFTLDQSVPGGFFQPLGDVVLREGEEVVVEVSNDTGEDGAVRLGLDAFRLTWVGDGDVEEGGACDDDQDCAGEALCLQSVCAPGCEVAGCSGGAACDAASGLCGDGAPATDAGPGAPDDGGGGPDGGRLPSSVQTGCGCAQSTARPGAALWALAALLVVALRARRG